MRKVVLLSYHSRILVPSLATLPNFLYSEAGVHNVAERPQAVANSQLGRVFLGASANSATLRERGPAGVAVLLEHRWFCCDCGN